MQTQPLKIVPPKGYQVSFDKSSGEIKFTEEPKDVLERINTDEDVLVANNHTWETFNKWCEGLQEHEKALRFLQLLMMALNSPNWIPDYDDEDQVKYEPRFIGGSSGFRFDGFGDWISLSYVGSRLCFEESRLAVHAGQKFTKWYKKAIVRETNAL